MDKINFLEGQIEGQTIGITAEIRRDAEAGTGTGWINLTVEAAGKKFGVGGADFVIGGAYEPYCFSESGDVAGITAALGYDSEDADTLESVLSDLHEQADDLYRAAAEDIESTAPECTSGDGHRWEAHPSDGCRENPGVWGVGGAAIRIVEYCLHCGTKRESIVGDVNVAGNRNGVAYEEAALEGDDLRKFRAAYDYEAEEEED